MRRLFYHQPSIQVIAHRKLGKINKELDRIASQNMPEKISNIKHDEGTIAGCLEDLGEALVDYQVRSIDYLPSTMTVQHFTS